MGTVSVNHFYVQVIKRLKLPSGFAELCFRLYRNEINVKGTFVLIDLAQLGGIVLTAVKLAWSEGCNGYFSELAIEKLLYDDGLEQD